MTSLQNLGAVTGCHFPGWHSPSPALIQGNPAPGQVGEEELLQQVA